MSNKQKFILAILTGALTFIFLMYLVTFAIWEARANNHDNNLTNRDRIAACVRSDDVVGCLKAAG